jgi:transposase-like protein
MKRKNKYVNRSRISEKKFRLIIKYFSLDLNAVQIAELTGLSRQSTNKYLIAVRKRIATYCHTDSASFSGHIEVYESYFGAKRAKGKRGCGAMGKTIVFGLLKREGKVYTEIVPDCSSATLQAIIRAKVSIDSVIYSDSWRGYNDNGLVNFGYKKYLQVYHDKNEFAKSNTHINAIESFWGYAKIRLVKFKGIDKNNFYLHLKESEFRFNNRGQNLYKIVLNFLRKESLKLS